MLGIPRQQRTGETVMDHQQSLGNKMALIWEVYARIGLAPIHCVHLLRRQGVIVTPSQAKQQIYQARRRNTLRLVHFPQESL